MDTGTTTDNFITVAKAEQLGVRMDSVAVCREIRKLAKLDRIELDESVHRSSLNTHLFSFIRYCGMEPRGYVRDYLSNLQPYMLERFPSQEVDKSYICVLDQMYRVSLYIKIDKTFGSEIIVSFHENNKRGIAKENNMLRPSGEEVVPVIADSIASKVIGTENYAINIPMQRGMLLLPIQVAARKCENGTFLVRRRDIETPIVDQCNQYIRDMYTSDLDLEALDQVELFSVLHQISFTSYGNTVFSNISLLIDNLALQKSVIGKKAADFALITYAQHIVLEDAQREELFHVIDEKYKVSSQRGIDVIIARVKDAVGSVGANEVTGESRKEIPEKE